MSGPSDRRRRLLDRLRMRKSREREAKVLVEGVRGVRDALEAGATPRFAMVSPRLSELAPDLLARLEAWTEVVHVRDEVVREASDTEAPQGVLAVVDEPGREWLESCGAHTRLLVLDGVQDPGNAGTLIRSAAAFALDGVLLLDGSVDPWNPKTVRSTAGAAFRCPIARVTWADADDRLARAGLPIWVASADGEAATSPGDPASGAGGWALVIGSEGRGAREAVLARAARRIAIPMPGGTESLNAAVAGSILVYELTRRERGLGS